ncbi:uncharacterized protein LOC121735666 [Aricia agestis]|uniref:uncharacterized protein LOC121735666 n=1 Tax=Aricia agestis TaxID=91739 RepID=UPI001C203732|nr:uncharacterized protein LOC121735666 [Aricia agestis]
MTPKSRARNAQNSDEEVCSRDKKRLKQRKSFRTLILEHVTDYSANSSLHGLKYIGEKKRTTIEKLFWILVFVFSLILCSTLIRNIYIKWEERPVIVSFAEQSTPVCKIPFPAVTLCFETKAFRRTFNYTSILSSMLKKGTIDQFTENQKIKYDMMSSICGLKDGFIGADDLLFHNLTEDIQFLKEMLPKENYVLDECGWKNTILNCPDMFTQILTDEGNCYTFNTLGPDDMLRVENLSTDYDYMEFVNKSNWSLENWYRFNASGSTNPRFSPAFGAKAGLELSVKVAEEDLDYYCKGPGVRILLHSPDEYPRLSQQYYNLPLGQEVVFAVKPNMMTTSKGLRPYVPVRRQCYFSDERYLRYFRVYNQGNCELECLTNFTYTKCGCVHFSMPHGPEIPVCSRKSDIDCMEKAQSEIIDFDSFTSWEEDHFEDRRQIGKCQCLPACTSLKYEAETSQSDFDIKKIVKILEDNYMNMTVPNNFKMLNLKIFFKEGQFITSKRSELYGRSDFIANCGGLLGLFLGFSLLSAVEILYFSTLRIWCLLWKNHRDKQSMKSPIVKVYNFNDKYTIYLQICYITDIFRASSFGNYDKDYDKTNDTSSGRVKVKRTKSSLFKDYLVDFTTNSNLHGLKYIGEKDRTPVEKIFWLFMFTCCVVLCSGLIRKVWIKWNESPVIVSFAETSTPVWQIPYPAVTVCFETKARQTVFNFTDYYHLYYNNETYANMTEEERNTFEDISLVCDDHLAPGTGRKTADGRETIEVLKGLSPNMSEVFLACKWKDVLKNTCEALFLPILTEEGHCYTFNTLGADDMFRVENLNTDYPYLNNANKTYSWTLETGYFPNTTLDAYPYRGSGYGVKAGLTFLLRAKQEELDYLCKGPVQGFKILLHNPAELPRVSQQYFRAPLSQEVIAAVKPKMMTTSDGLKPYDPTRRQCYFPSERYLRYFKVYTQANCEMECLTNFTLVRCGCVQFGMPHGPNIPVCNAGSVACIKQAAMELVTAEVKTGLNQHSEEDVNLSEARVVAAQCKCLPSCTAIEYEAETSQADYDWKAIFRAYHLPIEDEDEDLLYARVMVFFKEAQFITSKRSELYGQTDFLANCGGLLGLFMGFSFLSVAEILYFLTLRICCLLWKRRQHKAKRFKQNAVLSPEPVKVKQMYTD